MLSYNGLIAILQFDRQIQGVSAENSMDYNIYNLGSGVKIERNLHGNAFYSGDEVTFKIFVNCNTKEETEAIQIINSSISCIKG